MVAWLGRLEARLARGWGKVDVNFRRGHGISLTKLGWQRRERLCLVHALEVVALVVVLDPKATWLKLRERLLLRHQARGDVGAGARADMRVIVEGELPKLHSRVMEKLRISLRIEQGRGLRLLKAVVVR
jgi:hypothetical protein